MQHFALNTDPTIPSFVFTLTEKTTLTNPNYRFVFSHVTQKQEVEVTISAAEDLSLYPERFNEFPIDVNTLFANKALGQWHYRVFETDGTVSNEVENGKMNLTKTKDPVFKAYETQTPFKAYGG